MNKNSPLIAAIVGAVLIVLQQAVLAHNWDLKVVGLSVGIAILGAASRNLKGKGASFWGILGTVGFTLYNLLTTDTFSWNEFILTSLLAVVSVFAPTLIPQNANPDKE